MRWRDAILAAGMVCVGLHGCSTSTGSPPGPTPTPTPTLRPLPEPVRAKAEEVYPILARELALSPNQQSIVRTRVEDAAQKVFQLSIVPLSSQRSRVLLIRQTIDQFETDLLGLLTEAQLPQWDRIRDATRLALQQIQIPPRVVPTPLPPPPRPPGR